MVNQRRRSLSLWGGPFFCVCCCWRNRWIDNFKVSKETQKTGLSPNVTHVAARLHLLHSSPPTHPPPSLLFSNQHETAFFFFFTSPIYFSLSVCAYNVMNLYRLERKRVLLLQNLFLSACQALTRFKSSCVAFFSRFEFYYIINAPNTWWYEFLLFYLIVDPSQICGV